MQECYRFNISQQEAYKLGDMPKWGIGNIGWAYQYGKGVDIDIEMAKNIIEKL
jgi:hypothetical protein